MREILFRAWVKEFNMMFYPIDSWLNSLEGERRHPDCGNNKPKGSLAYICQEGNPIMQFTGLLDRNGKKIFEGDLLRGHLHSDIKKCVWFDEGAGFVFQDIHDPDWVWAPNEYSTANEWEIIGNVHEHPELLK